MLRLDLRRCPRAVGRPSLRLDRRLARQSRCARPPFRSIASGLLLPRGSVDSERPPGSSRSLRSLRFGPGSEFGGWSQIAWGPSRCSVRPRRARVLHLRCRLRSRTRSRARLCARARGETRSPDGRRLRGSNHATPRRRIQCRDRAPVLGAERVGLLPLPVVLGRRPAAHLNEAVNPRRRDHGPVKPYASCDTSTRDGLSSRRRPAPNPRRSIAFERRPWTITCAPAMSRSKHSRSPRSCRSRKAGQSVRS